MLKSMDSSRCECMLAILVMIKLDMEKALLRVPLLLISILNQRLNSGII
jgi:hypothetical protein